jgi:YVTN family beta-propeller protein
MMAGAVLHLAQMEIEANTQPRGPRSLRSVARFAFKFALAAVASASLVGCGNTYRPVVTAINPVGPAGQPTKYAIAISTTGPTTPGLVTFVDFSGDTVLITSNVGADPYYLALDGSGVSGSGSFNTAANGFILNRDTSVNKFPISTSLISSQILQTTLLSGANPVSIIPNGIYTYIPQAGRNSIATLTTSTSGALVLNQEFQVNNPGYVVGVTNAPRVYALGQDASSNGEVTTIETASNTPDKNIIPVGKNPVYGVMTADTKRVFVMNKGDGTVSVINAQTNQLDTVPSPATNPIALGAGTAPLWADFAPTRNELIVANAGPDASSNGSVSVISIPLCSVTSLPTDPNCDPNNPVDAKGFGTILKTVPVGINPVMVSVLQDGTRAYVANAGDPTLPCGPAPAVPGVSTVCSVSVINLDTNTVIATITGLPDSASQTSGTCTTASAPTLCGHPNWIVTTTGTPTGKVYVTSGDSTNMTIIRTDSDTVHTLVPLQGKGVAVRVTQP